VSLAQSSPIRRIIPVAVRKIDQLKSADSRAEIVGFLPIRFALATSSTGSVACAFANYGY
jgi:hypothetical protein